MITDIFDQLAANADLKSKAFRLDNDSLGTVNILADYSKRTGKINYRIVAPDQPYDLSIEGVYNTKDSTGSPLSTILHLNNTRIGFINRFLYSVFSDIDGYATGDLQMSGDITRPHLKGKVKLRNAGFKVNYTQVSYTVDEADLDFGDDRINFGSCALKYKRGDTGVGRGIL